MITSDESDSWKITIILIGLGVRNSNVLWVATAQPRNESQIPDASVGLLRTVSSNPDGNRNYIALLGMAGIQRKRRLYGWNVIVRYKGGSCARVSAQVIAGSHPAQLP